MPKFSLGRNKYKKSNWEKYSSIDKKNTTQNRDVYERQQLERGERPQMESPFSRNLIAIAVAIFAFIMMWMFVSVIETGYNSLHDMGKKSEISESVKQKDWNTIPKDQQTYIKIIDKTSEGGKKLAYQLNEDGSIADKSKSYEYIQDVPIPKWYIQRHKGESKENVQKKTVAFLTNGYNYVDLNSENVGAGFKVKFGPSLLKILLSFITSVITGLIVHQILMRNLDSQNVMASTTDINHHVEDQHIMLPEELQSTFDWFPDVGAHSKVEVSSLISHNMLSNKGCGHKIDLAMRYEEDIYGEDGDIEYHKGDIMYDDNGNIIFKKVPLFDEKFAEDLFEASDVPDEFRKFYSPDNIPYNEDGKNREKLGKFKTLNDLIKSDWTFPYYETQRPAGGYIVDTAAVNTMVLAATRAGKGQTIIEPTIDMWTREINNHNMVINDPKGELLVKFYIRGIIRGFDVVQFNLINHMRTNIYNPLLLAAEAARAGDKAKCSLYVKNIADVFFPVDGGDDPVWRATCFV